MACGARSSRSSRSSGGCGQSAAAPAPACGGGCPEDSGCGNETCCPEIPPAQPQEAPGPAPRARKSALEKSILCAKCPAPVSETATTCANGVRGIFVNKSEVDAFNGPIPIENYEIFNDPNPKIINKVCSVGGPEQEVSVKFLVPPAGPPAGDIVIRERAGPASGPAPPLIIRVEAEAGCAGKPQCFRECPPAPCPKICPQLIEICSAGGPPPPRKVIIENMPSGGPAPGPIYAERWLSASGSSTRNVVYEPAPAGPAPKNPRNVIINWTLAEGSTNVRVNSLGQEPTDPCAYKKKYGKSLSKDLPEVVRNLTPPAGTKLAGTPNCDTPTLVGCVSALKLVDLAAHGLEAYADQVANA